MPEQGILKKSVVNLSDCQGAGLQAALPVKGETCGSSTATHVGGAFSA
jgi:hypothetical protein